MRKRGRHGASSAVLFRKGRPKRACNESGRRAACGAIGSKQANSSIGGGARSQLLSSKRTQFTANPRWGAFSKTGGSDYRRLERSVSWRYKNFLIQRKGRYGSVSRIACRIFLIPEIVSAFRKLHPNVKFRFKQGMYPSLIHDVTIGTVDIAFVSPCPEQHDM